MNEKLNASSSVDMLQLSVRSANCLLNAEIRTVGDLLSLDPRSLLKIKNCGRKSVVEIQKCINAEVVEQVIPPRWKQMIGKSGPLSNLYQMNERELLNEIVRLLVEIVHQLRKARTLK